MRLPSLKQLFDDKYRAMKATFVRGKVPYANTPEQVKACDDIVHLFHKYLSSLFQPFHLYTIHDDHQGDPITVFVKGLFLDKETDPRRKRWFTLFLDTQMFFTFSDHQLHLIE